ncbi:MAG: leucine--tRNA ligase [Candidatus Sericytochromatia bacterium]
MKVRDYNFAEIEPKWQDYWESKKTFKTEAKSSKPKYYVLDMFPYPSGQGLHVGHPKGYVGSDVVANYKRMKGFNVLHPMGWDAFGLPTERQSVKENKHPQEITDRNVNTFRKQLKKIGLSYDWDREINTTDERYYKWTQWIFLKLYEKGLAYQEEIPVNWCPALNTVLSNEEVKDGKYVETGDDVEKRVMKQWMLKITAYSERLIADLDDLDWPESIKEMQRNWIGKSEGALVNFKIENSEDKITVFTTRPDTLFGGTYCVLAPENELVSKITTNEQKEAIDEYVNKTLKLSERDRLQKAEEKTGVFTGAYAINPVNNKQMPIWISDYVLASYGTGAVFACPAHDERDYAFAQKFNLPIIEVVKGGDISKNAYTEDGEHINSEFLDGLKIKEAKEKIISWLESNNIGKSEINYKLRDWLFSRQRYWGEPIPINIDPETGETHAVSYEELPIKLPYLENINPTENGEPPLARATEWRKTVDKKTGKALLREVNTMPQWAGSCWYYLAFMDPYNENEPWNKEIENNFAPVDLYVGGTEHATLHLLYARFWHKVLYDLGYVSTKEPFQKLFNQGLLQAMSFKDENGKYYYPHEVEEKEGKWFSIADNLPLKTKVEKMSKSRYNVTTPDEIIENYGADSLRLYELFMGPLEDGGIWQTDNISGVKRFLERVWNLQNFDFVEEDTEDKNVLKSLHKAIKKIGSDYEKLAFNTSISQLMILINDIYKAKSLSKKSLSLFAQLLAPMAPHISEEIWANLGNTESIFKTSWPDYDEELAKDDEIQLPVQINGKFRGTVTIQKDANEDSAKSLALANENVAKFMLDKNIVKVIYVPNKILNFIIK